MNITQEQFQSYVDVQESGITNMFDVKTVESISGLSRAKIMDIMKNYGTYAETFKVQDDAIN